MQKRLSDTVRGPALWTMLLAALIGSVWITGFTPDKMRTWGNAWQLMTEMYPPNMEVAPKVLKAMGETLGIAFLGTFLPFLLAFPVSFLTARNIGPWWVGVPLRLLMGFLRSVPEIIWAILFIVATTFGAVPGILALTAHNVGILSKLISEVMEEAPIGTQEAIASTGAGRPLTVWYGILPWAMPGILSHTFFRLECNIRTATVLGAVGAGGIGTLLMEHRALFMYDAMLTDTLGILLLVVGAEWLGSFVRRQVA